MYSFSFMITVCHYFHPKVVHKMFPFCCLYHEILTVISSCHWFENFKIEFHIFNWLVFGTRSNVQIISLPIYISLWDIITFICCLHLIIFHFISWFISDFTLHIGSQHSGILYLSNCFYLRYVSCIIEYVRDSQIGLLNENLLSISKHILASWLAPMENLVNCNKNWIFVAMSLNQLIYVQSQSIFLTKWTQNFNFKLQSWICSLSKVNHHHEIIMILSYSD